MRGPADGHERLKMVPVTVSSGYSTELCKPSNAEVSEKFKGSYLGIDEARMGLLSSIWALQAAVE